MGMNKSYYRDLGTCQPLTVTEERKLSAILLGLLAEREAASAAAPSKTARTRLRKLDRAITKHQNRLVRANLRLVVKLANRYSGSRLSVADLIQEGNMGLLIAVERFDHSRGVRFCTYAAWWIRHRMSRTLVNTGRAVRVPNHVAQMASRLKRASQQHEHDKGRTPNNRELAELTDMTEQRIALVLGTTGHASSLETRASEQGRSLLKCLADSTTLALDEMLVEERQAAVEAALQTLPPIERNIVRGRFDFDESGAKTLRQLGSENSLSRERIRQLQNVALRKLAVRLAAHNPSEVTVRAAS